MDERTGGWGGWVGSGVVRGKWLMEQKISRYWVGPWIGGMWMEIGGRTREGGERGREVGQIFLDERVGCGWRRWWCQVLNV